MITKLPGREAGDEFGGDLSRLIGAKEVHRHGQDQAHRAGKIQERADPPVVQDLGRVAQVPGAGQHGRAAGQQVPGVAQHLGVVIHIDDAGIRLDGLGGFVGVGRGGQPAAHVEELPDTCVRHVGDGAGLELPGLDGQLGGLRVHLENVLGLVPVGGEVVFAAQQGVVDSGDAGLPGAELCFGDTQLGPEPVHGSGLGEPGLHAGTGGVGDIEQPVSR